MPELLPVSVKQARKISLYKIRETIGRINTAIVATANSATSDDFQIVIPMGREALRLRKALSEFYSNEGWHTAILRKQVSKEPKRKYQLCFVVSTKPVKSRTRTKLVDKELNKP
jgi:hypothetical protein